jgi:hypothetical protein
MKSKMEGEISDEQDIFNSSILSCLFLRHFECKRWRETAQNPRIG